MEFRHFVDADYEAVCGFLIELNQTDPSHINWNWARFEWMYEHPEFDKRLRSSVGLWVDRNRVVGAAIYDMYFGEAFCGALPAYAGLYPEILDYAYRELKDDAGLAIAIADGSAAEIEAAKKQGFVLTDQSETVMKKELDGVRSCPLPEGLSLKTMDPCRDAYAMQWLFWQGFDHGEDRAAFERTETIVPRIRKHFRPELSVGAVNGEGEPVTFCGLWLHPKTDYAYVEPVCTIPAYRGKGAARAVIFEALNRAKALGAKRAYVISDMRFYEKLGFETVAHYAFYRKDMQETRG